MAFIPKRELKDFKDSFLLAKQNCEERLGDLKKDCEGIPDF